MGTASATPCRNSGRRASALALDWNDANDDLSDTRFFLKEQDCRSRTRLRG